MNRADYEYAEVIGCAMRGDSVTTRNSTVMRASNRVNADFFETPLVTVRKAAWKSALREWEWFMSGSDDINDLHKSVHGWWKPWANTWGRVYSNYSRQFRNFAGGGNTVDQIEYLIDGIKNHPYSRRNVITTWNTADMVAPETPITNCHGTVIQAFVDPKTNELDLFTYQRSVDVICGLPHNWIQYWAFLMWLAHRSGRKVGRLEWCGGDVHVYDVHEPIVKEIGGLKWGSQVEDGPNLVYNPTSQEFKADDFTLDREYVPLTTTKAEMVV